MKKLILLLTLCITALQADETFSWYTLFGWSTGAVVPGSCNSPTAFYNNITGGIYICEGGVYKLINATGGSSGTGGTFALNGLISGGGVAWTGGLNFTVSAATYLIGGVTYTSPQTNITLATANPSNDRIDVIAVNNAGVVVVVQGTPAATPVSPTIDVSSQLQLTFVYVAAAATTPSNVATTLVYDENVGASTEWNGTASGSGFNKGSVTNPYHGSVDTEATAVTTGNSMTWQKGTGTVDLSTYNSLVFYIRSKATWGNNRSLTIYFANGGSQVGNALTFANNSYGFISSNTSSYQQIVVPLGVFGTGSNAVNQVVFKVAGSGGSIGFYLDWVQLQSGSPQGTSGTPMNWRGTWSSTTAYNVYDVVTYGGTSYVALQLNTNVTPGSSATTWAAMATVTAQLHIISFSIDGGGSAITTGDIGVYPTVAFACTINRIDISADQPGSITVDVWKAAGAIPTSGNKISASAPLTLSSAQLSQNGSRTGWTTSVSSGDVFGFSVASASTVTKVTGQIWCQ